MKVTPALKKELANWLDTYWSTYLKGDIETWATLIRDDYRNIGGTKEEIWNSKQEIIDYTYSILDQMAGTVDIRNRKVELIPYGEYMMVHEFTDLYVKVEGEWAFYGPFRMSSLLEKTDTGWIALHQHGSYPDMKAMEGEAFSIDALKAENAKLQAAVKSRTIELEIETALEKVRAEAMGIKKPDDILAVCKIMFRELHLLGFPELRNTLINFWDDERSSLIDYDYSAETGGHKAILSYSSHPVFEQFQQKIKNSQDAFAELVVTKDELESWKQRRRDSGEYEDPRLNNISALYYYFYSIGVGAIGISTFKSISEEQLNILKRFRNVFDFAYRRYADVAQAEAQAREAEIELALERVRARTMAMQKSEELPEAANLLFQQIQSLGMPAWSAGYCTWNDNKQAVTLWMSTEGALQPPFKAPTTEDELFIQMRLGEKKGETLHIVEMGGDNLAAHYKYMRTLPVVGGILDSVIEAGHPLPTFQIMHYAYFSKGFLLFITYEPVPASHDIFIRFAKVFEQTYTRFLDLQKAEAQAREAKIEAALERTRTQSMLMQHSEQLDDTLRVFHEQVLLLGIHSAFSFLWLPDEQNERHIFWAAWEDKNLFKSKAINYPLNRNEPATAQCLIDWRSNEPVHSYAVPPEGVKDYFAAWKELLAGVEKLKPEYFAGGLHYVEAFMKYGCFGVMVETGLAEDEKKLLSRFAIEFERTYTRFLDLQKAEAQAREAQIEASLERVRSKTMAMQRSDDLFEVIHEVNAQLQLLNFRFDSADFLTDYSAKGYKIWVASVQETVPEPFYINAGNSKITMLLKKAMERGNDFFTFTLNREDKNKYFDHVFQTPVAKNASEEAKQFIYKAEGMAVSCFVVKNIILSVANFACIPYKDDENDILRRFAFVFEQSYTRFLDLQKAELQAKEAQLELSLERIRAKVTAMQQSNELLDIVVSMRTEFVTLGHEANYFWYMRWLPDKYEKAMTSGDGTRIGMIMTLPRHIHGDIKLVADWEKSNDPSVVYAMDAETAVDYVAKMINLGDFKQVDPNAPSLGDIRHIGGLTFIMARTTYGEIGFSLPGVVTDPPAEAVTTLIRFAAVFDLAYRRFEDLKNAELRNRQTEIELALEKVRSRSMAMHKSEELKEVIQVVYDQFVQLSIPVEHAGFIMDYKERNDMHIWLADQQAVPFQVTLPYFNCAHWNSFNEAKANGNNFFTNHLTFEEKNKFYQDLFKIIPGVPEETLSYYFKCPGLAISTVLLENIGLYIENFSGIPFTEDENEMLMRFGKVFQQTYTRFLDLQKAEAQAKEAQIETALERVRSRSLAMHHSSELSAVVDTLLREFTNLEFTLTFCIINLINEQDRSNTVWAANPETGMQPESYYMKFEDYPFHHAMWNAWKEQKKNFIYTIEGEEKKIYDEYLYTKTEFRRFPKHVQEANKALKRYVAGFTFSRYSGLQTVSENNISDDELNILERFGRVFEQSYTRFLDLQKAEAQARESQIEAALERVRSRTMSMQHSAELGDVAAELFVQMNLLVTNLWTCGFVLCEKNRDEDEWWLSMDTGFTRGFFLPNIGDFAHATLYEGWIKNDVFRAVQLEGETLQQHYDWLMNLPVARSIFEEMEKAGLERPDWQKLHAAYFSKGYLVLITREPCNEEEIFKRFAQVFDQTYTRFLDLQKAESQARQAKIETALEKVRARALAMQQPEELVDVAKVLRHEMGLLGVEELETCSIFIHDEAINRTECWYALKDIHAEEKKLVSDHFPLNLHDTWVGREMEIFYRSDAKQVSIQMQGTNRKEWINYCEERSIPFRGYYGEVIPDRTYHLYKFSHGAIGAASAGDISTESWDLLQRAASVFSLAYSRFKDLTQARIDLQRLKTEKQRAEDALAELQVTQKQLIQSEKMASLGELTAGIAHEIQNPLNFVNNFSEVSNELIDEMNAEIEKGDMEEAKAIANDIKQNLEKINHHGKRADAIVKGMLQHSRSSSAVKEPTDINKLADEYLRLAYHGLRAKDKSFNAIMKTDFDNSIGNINIIPQDIGRVILNLITNAFYEVDKKKKACQAEPAYRTGRPVEAGYEPTVSVSTKKEGNNVLISVKDNGNGIPQKVLDKIFQPFFTTKPTGQGTGLGLSLSYDIVKAHGGDLKVETKPARAGTDGEGEGSEFIIIIPIA